MQAEITTDGTNVLGRIPYANGAGPIWAKKVPGARWDKDRKVWRYPLTMDTCRTFRRIFGPELTVLPPLSRWAREAIAEGEKLEELRAGGAIELDRVAKETPFLHAAISTRSYQVGGAGFLTMGGQVILGDEPGLGKTLQTLAALVQRDARRILVSCPRTATRNVWERETMRWAPHIATYVAQGTHDEREAAMLDFIYSEEEHAMLIINNEMVRAKKCWRCKMPELGRDWRDKAPVWTVEPGKRNDKNSCQQFHEHESFYEYLWPFLFERDWDAVVIDEAHNLLASTYNTMSKNITQGRLGAMLLRKQVAKDGAAFALSGTPFRSKLTKAWGTLNWVRPDVFGSYWNFAGTHFGVVDGRFGRVIQPDQDGKAAKVPVPLDEAAWDAALRPYYLVRTKAAAAPDLPPINYIGAPPLGEPNGPNYVWLDMDEKQAQAYSGMVELAEAYIDGGRITAAGQLAELTRLRQFAVSSGKMVTREDMEPALPSNKLDWLLEFLEERDGAEGKVLVASQFTKIVHLINEELRKKGIQTLTLTGATTDKGRTELVRRFNDPDDSAWVAIINSRAGGEAITLDAVCDDLVIIDPLWTSDEEFQLVSRIHRVSRIHQVNVYRLISNGTVEDWMTRTTDEQRHAITSNRPEARKSVAEAVRWQRSMAGK